MPGAYPGEKRAAKTCYFDLKGIKLLPLKNS
jgi:hypothetical protein